MVSHAPPPADGLYSQQPSTTAPHAFQDPYTYPAPPGYPPTPLESSQAATYFPPPPVQTFAPPPSDHKHASLFTQPTSPPPPSSLATTSAAPVTSRSKEDETGLFNGGSYRISHRSTNTLLTIQLAIGAPLVAKPGTMLGMSPSVTLSGAFKFALRKWVAGASLAHSHFTGPGEVLLAPAMLGDVAVLHLETTTAATATIAAAAATSLSRSTSAAGEVTVAQAKDDSKKGAKEKKGLFSSPGKQDKKKKEKQIGERAWRVGKENFLACTAGVHKDVRAQGVGKAFFSGEGWYTYVLEGSGVAWVASFGAVVRKDLADGEQYIVDNNHLVAWNASYTMERVASGGIISELSTSEGVVCKFTGPGTVYLQTRSAQSFLSWLNGHGAVK